MALNRKIDYKTAATDYKITTLGSHSALQILKGAKDEGFSTICVALKGKEMPYKMFNVADEVITIESHSDFFKIEDRLIKKNAIIVPHASFIAYMPKGSVENIRVPYYGNKQILQWEADRNRQREWLLKAGVKMPRRYTNPKDIDKAVIVKFHGADGGKGYFIAKDERDFNEKIKARPPRSYVIQEYIVGVPIYAHYFYSSLTEELEIMSFDIRYESNVDSLGRISARDQIVIPKIDPSYVIVGNIPVVVRESLLPMFIDIGYNVVKESRNLTARGLFGPFCLEGVITPELEFYCFEISARIVAGTNPYIYGSPYTWLKYKEPMSTGRRIAREIKMAIKQKKLAKVLG